MVDAMYHRFEISISFPLVRRKDRRVFIVHGHDSASKETVMRFLEDLGLIPVILHDRPNEGRTLIGKLERNANVGFVIVLLTPDDQAHPVDKPHLINHRARQNVIFELGFFIGKLGRNRVCALYKEGVEIPSDLLGFAYLSIDDGQEWKRLLAREIEHTGLKLNLERAFLGLRKAV